MQVFADSARLACRGFCESLSCGATGNCASVGAVLVSQPDCQRSDTGWWTCTARIKQCTCGCEPCAGSHKPSVNHRWAHGYMASPDGALMKMREAARKICDEECARYRDCQAPADCKRAGEPQLGEEKTWSQPEGDLWGASAEIKKCHCGCA